jgi:glycosyltransferase involved in cell wall biosynthesis
LRAAPILAVAPRLLLRSPHGDRLVSSAHRAAPIGVLGLVGEPMTGVGYARFFQPFAHLRGAGFTLRTLGSRLDLHRGPRGLELDPALYDGISMILVPQMIRSPALPGGERVELLARACERAAERGVPIVYSADDHVESIDANHPSFETMRASAGNLDLIREHATAAIVTTEPLSAALRAWGLPLHVLPNTVEPGRFTPRPRDSGELRIGWAGSSSHLDDLAFVLPAIRRIARRLPCRLMLLGLCDRPLDVQAREILRDRAGYDAGQRERADRFLEIVRLLDELPHRHVPFQPVFDYFHSLGRLDADIAICPLLDTPFNRHRSALKFYEYAMAGSMTVASQVPTYASEVSVTVPNDPASWSDVLERYMRDEPARERELERQRAYVLTERNVLTWSGRWAEVLRSILDTPVLRGRSHVACHS